MSPSACGFWVDLAEGTLRTWAAWLWLARLTILELSPGICAVVAYTLWQEERR